MSTLPKEDLEPTHPAAWTKGPFKLCKSFISTFSSTDERRNAPSSKKTQHVRLITIGPSHFCEKVRWALDILENDLSSPIFYTEDAHPPVFQSISSLEVSGGEASMVPMVVIDGENGDHHNNVIFDSRKIVEHFCPFLYPNEEVRQLETYFGSHIGATIRCYLYHLMLNRKYHSVLAKLVTVQSSSIEKFLWGKLLDRGLAKGMRKVMGITPELAKESLETLRMVFDEVSDRLKLKNGEKKSYIMDTDEKGIGGGFTAADLTFAALASPVIQPPELSQFLPLDEDMAPPELILLRDELRATLAGQHVLEMYKKHRKAVVPKVLNIDRLPYRGIIATGVCAVGISFVSNL